MKKILAVLLSVIILVSLWDGRAFAGSVPQVETPNYKVAFYASENYHVQDANGKRSGYGYEMMQNLSKHLQCTFSYVGYEKSAAECIEMLREGDIDLYTAAKITAERRKEFAVSKHPAITAYTRMNIKVGNQRVIAGDYSTYEGMRIGFLKRNSYNERIAEWADQKGFSYECFYYETQKELSDAMVSGEIDAVVGSYLRTPEDELTIEEFGETPYYIIARKEDQELIDALDDAFDQMSLESMEWRVDLYNKYYGTQAYPQELTEEEQQLLKSLQENHTVIKAVMNPDNRPYSWYEDGEPQGIIVDLFRSTAEKLDLGYEILPVSTKEAYRELVASGSVDIWMDMDSYYESDGASEYKSTTPYLSTTVSVLKKRDAVGTIEKLALIAEENVTAKEIITENWEDVTIVEAEDTQACVAKVLSGEVDGAFLMTYTAQKLARSDVQNRLCVDIVPGAEVQLQMGINAKDENGFFSLWQKTLMDVSEQSQFEVVQSYANETTTPTLLTYLFVNPLYLIGIIGVICLIAVLVFAYFQTAESRNKQQKMAAELTVALQKAEEATVAKQQFFSKMSHDIRTPLNVVLGMTQLAKRYKQDPERLQYALDSIYSEGNYLLVMINSILDVNQLEHGRVELLNEAFNPAACVQKSVEVLKPLADKKSQKLMVACDPEDWVVVGDVNRCSQIAINIISNAIKYTNPGGHIEVSLERLEDERWRFVCTDDGIGMTEEFLKHITEDYIRAEDQRVSKVQGAGLGMSVVKGLVDLMGGTLQIDSAPGLGSTFIVELPFGTASSQEREQVLHPISLEEERMALFSGQKVLLVEDNVLNAEIAKELLLGMGLQVDWAEDGLRAVKLFEESEPGAYFVVFMDMQMPIMDGIEATKRIRASAHPDHAIPIFAMTANTFASDRKLCSDVGMNGYIAKPISVEEIAAILQKELEEV